MENEPKERYLPICIPTGRKPRAVLRLNQGSPKDRACFRTSEVKNPEQEFVFQIIQSWAANAGWIRTRIGTR